MKRAKPIRTMRLPNRTLVVTRTGKTGYMVWKAIFAPGIQPVWIVAFAKFFSTGWLIYGKGRRSHKTLREAMASAKEYL